MRISHCRLIDSFIGKILCSILLVKEIIFSSLFRKKAQKFKNKVLVIKFFGFGSILLSTPCLALIKREIPDCVIHYLTFKSNEPICNIIPQIDKVYTLDIQKNVFKIIINILEIYLIIKGEKYDIVLDLEFFSNYTTSISYLINAPVRVALGNFTFFRRKLYTDLVYIDTKVHISDIYLSYAKKFIKSPLRKEELYNDINIAIPDRGKDITKNVESDKNIILNINAGELSLQRRWPLESFVKLSFALLSKFNDINIIVIGGKNDVDYVRGLPEELLGHKRVMNFAGKCDLYGLTHSFLKSKLYIGNDGGPMHLAWITNTPCVVFFGPETPTHYGPLKVPQLNFFASLDCCPCFSAYTKKVVSCKNARCMKMIRFEEIQEKLIRFAERQLY